MRGLVVVSASIPWAEKICLLFREHGFSSQVRDRWEEYLLGDPAAIILSLQNWDEPIHENAARLRDAGFEGALVVLGRISPDLTARQKLAENEAWFMPALSGPEDIVSRVRMLC